MASIQQEASAVVIGYRDHGESDKILSLYLNDYGKITAIAKGANRSQKRFVNKLEPFSFLQVYFQAPRTGSLFLLTDAELYNPFLNLRKDYALFSYGSVILELLQFGIEEKENDPALFKLVLWALHTLNADNNPSRTLLFFLLKFYDILGYRPDFSACMSCGTLTGPHTTLYFNHDTGVLICNNCIRAQDQSFSPLSTGTIKLMENSLATSINKIQRIVVSKHQKTEALGLLYRYGKQLFQRELNAFRNIVKSQAK